ncbi:Rexo1 protein [Epithele typhae]|uniref:Rexo1 protein n=1 Tax=Epithele typhae TaxID=378194 RepID=UPI0020082F9B|nr:Rexo1 protein [Epithele typhae]KAH9943468.1 Rexo1 protein [Epithele typhae]
MFPILGLFHSLPSCICTFYAASSSFLPVKRPNSSPASNEGSSNGGSSEPPRKFQRVGKSQRPVAVPSGPATSARTRFIRVHEGWVPLLRVSPAMSQVAIPVRQTMLKVLYTRPKPTLAAEHALKQEEELTYRNTEARFISHPSVGTESEVQAREEARKKIAALCLTTVHLEPYVLSMDQMKQWEPHEEGSPMACDRCNQRFIVKRRENADHCRFHWGRREKRRVYTCCSRTTDEEGCETGPHVFYESDPDILHSRHGFTSSRPKNGDEDSALDIVALDCEMIYSTGGMRVARVSVVDGTGNEVLDKFIRMDDGVEVIDFNTRFSGINEENYSTAVHPLESVRESLDSLINSETIIIGHALENDLKTLRMIHHRCVDTVVLFPHQQGHPYRRALRALAKEFLGQTIQAAGAAGHSSIEDSVATLDLVRWHVINKPRPKPPARYVALA